MPIKRFYFLVAFLFASMLLATTIVNADDYQLGEGDLLHISVFDHAELALDARISQSGNISYPLIGQIKVGGLSTHDAEQLIATKLSEGGFIRQPQVSILVGDFQSQKASVIGQVSKPGQFPLIGKQKVLDLIAMAGGVLPDLAADQATLISANGNVRIIDLRRLFDGDLSMNPEMRSGDVLSVPHAPQFYIYGEVQHPGVYRLDRDMTISQAIAAGGGLTKHGTERGVTLKRRDSKGTERQYHPNSKDTLKPDDVLLVKESLF